MKSQEVVNFVCSNLAKNPDLKKTCDKLIAEAIARKSDDNVTAVIIFLIK